MTTEEVLNNIKNEKPRIVYISGKTSTGKTTFANQLQAQGYTIIELDEIVKSSIEQAFGIKTQSEAFITAYRDSGPSEQTEAFILAVREKILKEIKISPVVIEGAIAKSRILKEIFSGELADFYFVYFHPVNHEIYRDRIKERFVGGVATNSTGLPKGFWSIVEDRDLEDFKQTRVLNDKLEKAIVDFSNISMKESGERLDHFKESFTGIHVVEI